MVRSVDKLVVEIKFAAWLKYYLLGVELISQITGLDPDFKKVEYWISRGIKIGPVRGPRNET